MAAGFDDYAYLQRVVRDRTGIDLGAYKRRQMERRLRAYLQRVGAADFFQLARQVEGDPERLRQLVNFLTINVSEFFRNPEQFERLRTQVLPDLHRCFGPLRLWSAGCSIGCEPYSLAILIEEMDAAGAHRILATDVDREALSYARDGVYPADRLTNVPPAWRCAYFQPVEGQSWRVSDALRKRVQFQVHNLLVDPYPRDQHLILCRNVVIYFTEEAKEWVWHRLAEALVPGGYLLVGGTESIFDAPRFGLRAVAPFLYQRLVRERARAG